MALNACPFCDHGNQAAAKYCSECGGCLHLLPCPNCGSVSDISVSTCPQCKYVIPGRQTTAEPMLFASHVTKVAEPIVVAPQMPVAQAPERHALTVPSPTLDVPKPATTKNNRAMVGLAVLAGVAALGYYGYKQGFLADFYQPSTAGSASQGRAGPGSAGVIRQETTPAAPNVADGALSTAPAASAAVAAPAAANEALAARPPAGPNGAAVAAAPVASAPATPAAGASERSAASDKCTDAALALGLCAPTPALPAVTHTERKE